MGRSAAGVRGMKLRDDDEVVACAVTREGVDILIVTEAGYGKRTKLDKFPAKGRGTMGVKGIKITARKGGDGRRGPHGRASTTRSSSSRRKGTLIRMAVRGISAQGRDASGVRVMNVGDDETVVAVAPVFVAAEGGPTRPTTPRRLPVDETPPSPR